MKDRGGKMKLSYLESKINVLEYSIDNSNSRWYKKIPIVISVMAFVFSLGTTCVSYIHTKEQDIQNYQNDLRNILQRISLLDRETVEVKIKYSYDPTSLSAISGCYTQEMSLLANHAVNIINSLPSDRITAHEYYAISRALALSMNINEAIKYAEKSICIVDDLNTELNSRQNYASLLFNIGEIELGRTQFEIIFKLFDRYKGVSEFDQKQTHIHTHLNWALIEANNGYLDEATLHIKRAKDILTTMSPSPGKTFLENQVDKINADISTTELGNSLEKLNKLLKGVN